METQKKSPAVPFEIRDPKLPSVHGDTSPSPGGSHRCAEPAPENLMQAQVQGEYRD